MGQPMPNQMQQMQLNQQGGLPNQMASQVNQMSLQNQMGGQMGPQQLPPNMNPQMSGQMGPQQLPPNMNPQMGPQQVGAIQMGAQMGGQMQHMTQRNTASAPQGFPGPRNQTPTQFLTQSPTQGKEILICPNSNTYSIYIRGSKKW